MFLCYDFYTANAYADIEIVKNDNTQAKVNCFTIQNCTDFSYTYIGYIGKKVKVNGYKLKEKGKDKYLSEQESRCRDQ
jgi:hypothetical protein